MPRSAYDYAALRRDAADMTAAIGVLFEECCCYASAMFIGWPGNMPLITPRRYYTTPHAIRCVALLRYALIIARAAIRLLLIITLFLHGYVVDDTR